MTETTFRAVPLASLGKPKAEVTISADSSIIAFERAKVALGTDVPFDLCDGARVVLSHRPVRRWGRTTEAPS